MARDPFEAAALALGGTSMGGSLSSAGPPLPLEAHARLVGGYQWVERRLFEVLGTWVESEPLAEAQLVFDVYSQQHAWHTELFAERLPVVDSLDADTATLPPSIEVERMLGELSGASSGGTLLRLVGLSRVVLPRLVAGYTLHLHRAGTVSDAPLARSLRFVVRDEIEQWQVVEVLAQTLLRRPNDVAVVTAHQARLEEFVAERGPGLVPWPDTEERTGVASSPSEVDLDGSVFSTQSDRSFSEEPLEGTRPGQRPVDHGRP